MVSSDGTNWTNLGQYQGPTGATDALRVHNDFPSPVSCQFIRIYPGAFSGYRVLRADAYTKSLTAVTNNTKVSFWEDQTYNNNNAVQTTAANQLTYRTNQINGNPALLSTNASNTWMDIPDQSNLRTTFWVAKDNSATGTNYFHILYGNSATTPYYHTGTSGQMQWSGAASDAQVNFWKDGVDGTIATAYDFGANGQPNLITSYANLIGSPISAMGISYQAGNNRSWEGPIAEIISHQQQLTTTQREQVETYLGIKYGINLGHNYVAADGTILWNQTANTGYNNDVFGIGRSDCQQLHQRQSKSADVNAALTIGNNNFIENTNGNISGTNNISTNNSFLLVGDNGADLTWANSGIAEKFLDKVWKVQETGTIGSVKLRFTCQSTPGANTFNALPVVYSANRNLFLVVSNDAVIDATDTKLAMTYDNTTATYQVDLDLTSGQFFTVSTTVVSPGGVSENNMHWLRADNPDITLSGTSMDFWPDGSPYSRHMYKATGTTSPTVEKNSLNFNPAVRFNGSTAYNKTSAQGLHSFTSRFTAAEVFGIVKGSSNANVGYPWDYGGSSRESHWLWSDNNLYDGFATNDRLGYGPVGKGIADSKSGVSTIVNSFDPFDWSLYNVRSATNNWGINVNTNIIASTTTNTPDFSYQTNAGIRAGSHGGRKWIGWMPEIILFNRVLTPTERNQVNTYLGIKYGINLTHDYVGPNGAALLWNRTANAAYSNNVFGIARSDVQSLHQRQSSS